MPPSHRAAVQTSRPAPAPRWRHPEFLAAALGLAMLVAQAAWLAASQRLLEYDDAWYLELAIQFKRALTEQGWGALLAQLRGAFRFKAPGISVLAALVMAAVGESPRGAIAVSLVAWVLGSIYLALLARRFLSPGAAVLAAVLSATMPLTFSLARVLLVEAWLTLAVVAFLFHAAASHGLRRPAHLAALSLWGAMGLLLKVSFPAYVVIPALLLSAAPRPVGRGGWIRWGATWAGVALVSSGVAAWLWYADNWRAVLEYTRSVSGGALAAQYAVPVSDYLVVFALHAVSPWNLIAGLGLLALAVAGRAAGVRWAPIGVALAWIVPPALLLGSSSARYVRYLAPVLPAAALILAALAEPWLRRSHRHAAAVAGVLLIPPLVYFVVATVPTPLAGAVRGWATAAWIGANVTSSEAPPDRRAWPNQAIVAAVARAAGNGSPALLRLNVDLPELNHNNLKVEALLQRVPVVPAQIDQASPEGAVVTALDGDFLLLQTGGEVASDSLNLQRSAVVRELATGRHPYRELASYQLPGQRGLALLARFCEVGEELVAGAPPLAVLERGVELLTLDLAGSTGGLISVRTRYRMRSGSHPELAALVQLAGPGGRVLGGQEHALCRRPSRWWPPGTVVEDTFLLPAGALASGVELRLGLRDLQSGAKLRVERAGAGSGSAEGATLTIPDLARRLSAPATR